MGKLHGIYNSLGDVYEAAEIVASRPNLLPALARLLTQHKLDKAYDIRLNHKHFDITKDEQVVSFIGADLELSAVCTEGEIPIGMLSTEGVTPVPDGVIMPSDLLIKNGVAIPYEFAYSSSETIPSLNPQFLNEWCKILRDEDVDCLLGLSLRDDNVPMNTHEISNPESRINRLIFGDALEEGISVVSTSWRVDEVNGIIETKKCRWCSEIQRHGRKCAVV
jgi:hypothetical protein